MSFSDNRKLLLFNGGQLKCRSSAAQIAISDFLCKNFSLAFLWISKTFEGTYLTAVVTYPRLVFKFVLLLNPWCKTVNGILVFFGTAALFIDKICSSVTEGSETGSHFVFLRLLGGEQYRKIHCLTSEFHVKFHARNRYRTNREAMSAISVFQVKFNVEFTRQAVNFS